MKENASNVNLSPVSGGVAQVTNVAMLHDAIKYTKDRNPNLPGICVFYAPSGFGKSVSASYVATLTRAYYVQASSIDTKKSFLEKVLREMNIAPVGTATGMLDLISSELAKSGKPLIVDEFDHLVTAGGKGGKVELIRDIYESSQGTIIIIGEEMLPKKLERWERFHGRVLNWVQAQPASIADAMLLAQIYCEKVAIDEAVLAELVGAVRGSTRRVCTNLEMLGQKARENGQRSVAFDDLKRLLPHGFITGESPKPRSFF
ncbi:MULTISPECIES: AAA family ATPase [unclassified Moraxella]|uniref:AAA family ATPase n=1 Tax=unclassified Moraxella TaxID=2685852 RepID=UPI003AF61E37